MLWWFLAKPYVYSLWFRPQRWEYLPVLGIEGLLSNCIPKPSFIYSYSLCLRYIKVGRIWYHMILYDTASVFHFVCRHQVMDTCENLQERTKNSLLCRIWHDAIGLRRRTYKRWNNLFTRFGCFFFSIKLLSLL